MSEYQDDETWEKEWQEKEDEDEEG